MNLSTLTARNILAVALATASLPLAVQDAVSVEKLKTQLLEMQENLEKQKRQMESLQKQMEALQSQRSAAPGASNASTNFPSTAVRSPSATPEAAPLAEPGQKWSPSDPIPVLSRGSSYLNLSLDGLFAAGSSTRSEVEKLQLGGHDPNQRGFTLQNLETTFDGAVDPYFRGQANIVFQIDAQGESNLEIEEAYLESKSLPGNLQLRAGQILTEFGRLNPSHPHGWAFVDQPLVNGRFFGPDGLRNPGARLSWLIPTPFYSELFLSVQNSQGATASSFRHAHPGALLFGRPGSQTSAQSFTDLLFTPRYALSFDLTGTQTLLLGTSAAFGPNGSGVDQDTQIYGVDAFWKWKPAQAHAGFPFVSWQTEAMLRRFDAGAYDGSGALLAPPALDPARPAESLTDYGFYSQIAYGFRQGWIAGLRGDYVQGERGSFYPDPDRDPRWRISPNLTWYPSEFSKFRLQYNYDDRHNVGEDHSVWLQFEFLLGAHAAHKF